MDKKLVIIDTNALLHRAYHALPPLTNKKGELVNALYGLVLVFLKMIKDLQPNYLIAAFDFPAPTFRHQEFKEYKAQRPKTPNELADQINKAKEIMKCFNVPVFEKSGFEADDLIGTLSSIQSFETILVTGDLDLLQLINSRVKVYFLRKGVKDTVLFDEKAVREKYQGLKPSNLIDFKALKGDPSDNIPGVPGIGEKTGIELIKKFHNIENLYQKINEWDFKPKIKENLIKFKDQAFLSKSLVSIKKDIPLDINLKEWSYNKQKVEQKLKELEFYSLIPRLP